MESTPAFDNTPDSGYNNTIDFSKPIKIDMTQAKPLHEPHEHEYEHDPHDLDSHLGDVHKCRYCDAGIIIGRP